VLKYEEVKVSGETFDGKKRPLEGVYVKEKGSSVTSSTFRGYEIYVNTLQDTLIFSKPGYRSRTVALNGRNSVDITLKKRFILRDPEPFSDLFFESIGCSIFTPYLGIQGGGWSEKGYSQSIEFGFNAFFLQASTNVQYSFNSDLIHPLDFRLFIGLTTTILQAQVGYAFAESTPLFRVRSEWVLPFKEFELGNMNCAITGFMFYEKYLKKSSHQIIGIGFNIIVPFSYHG
jgi:hypothetical protein